MPNIVYLEELGRVFQWEVYCVGLVDIFLWEKQLTWWVCFSWYLVAANLHSPNNLGHIICFFLTMGMVIVEVFKIAFGEFNVFVNRNGSEKHIKKICVMLISLKIKLLKIFLHGCLLTIQNSKFCFYTTIFLLAFSYLNPLIICFSWIFQWMDPVIYFLRTLGWYFLIYDTYLTIVSMESYQEVL